MRILLGWVINALSLLALPYLIDAVQVSSFGWAIVAAILYSLVSWAVSSLLPGRRD